MIDKFAFRRKVIVLEHCLTLARAYYEQDKYQKSEYYSRLASEYFGEIVGLFGKPEPSMDAKENRSKRERVGLLG
jgi:hypothetical protein